MRKVALLIDRSFGYGQDIILGVSRYSSLHSDWELYVPPPDYLDRRMRSHRMSNLPWFKECKPDGVIMLEDLKSNEGVIETGVSAVLANVPEKNSGLPHIKIDNHAIGKMAVEYFVNRGFKSLVHCGLGYYLWATQRYEGFSAATEQFGLKAYTYNMPKSRRKFPSIKERDLIADWLKTLPKPIGLFACNDDMGKMVADACKKAGILVPEEIAILGVDNDEVVCMTSNPPLSSICLTTQKCAYEAAVLLDKIMNNKKIENKEITIIPTHVITRQSTNIMAIENQQIARAVQFIRQNPKNPIQVNDVVREIDMPRRTMEKYFRSVLGRSVHDEIARVRVENISQMLAETSMTISQIAKEFGFSDATHLTRFFREKKGLTPLAHRKQLSIA